MTWKRNNEIILLNKAFYAFETESEKTFFKITCKWKICHVLTFRSGFCLESFRLVLSLKYLTQAHILQEKPCSDSYLLAEPKDRIKVVRLLKRRSPHWGTVPTYASLSFASCSQNILTEKANHNNSLGRKETLFRNTYTWCMLAAKR